MEINKRMDRSWENYSQERVELIQKNTSPASYSSDWTAGKNGNNIPQIEGKTFVIEEENGIKLTYEFISDNKLIWEEDNETHESFYKAYEVPGHSEVIFVHHIRDGIMPVTCIDLILDLETNLATVIKAQISGNEVYPRDVEHTIHFASINGMGKGTHEFSTDLIGKAILWEMPSYTMKPPIKHIYLSPMYYGIYMTRDDTCYMTADPADYIKIKEDVYVISIIEKHRSGIQLTFAINTNLIEDVVGHFGISAGNELDGSEPKVVCTMITGRKGRFVPMETI